MSRMLKDKEHSKSMHPCGCLIKARVLLPLALASSVDSAPRKVSAGLGDRTYAV